jgi:hypothetical protein
MAKYLISFPSAAMVVPAGEFKAVGRDAHAVIDEAKAAGVYVFGGGIDESVPPVLVSADGTVAQGGYPGAPTLDGGFTVLELPSRGEAVAVPGMGQLVTVRGFTTVLDAQVACAVLPSAALGARLRDEHVISIDWLLSNAVGGVKPQVPADQLDVARDMIDPPAPIGEPPQRRSSRMPVRNAAVPARSPCSGDGSRRCVQGSSCACRSFRSAGGASAPAAALHWLGTRRRERSGHRWT